MTTNNFQQLLDEDERSISDFQRNQIDQIGGGIWRSLHMFRFIGAVFQIYLPQFAQTIIGSTTDSGTSSETVSYQSPPNEDLWTNIKPLGPSNLRDEPSR